MMKAFAARDIVHIGQRARHGNYQSIELTAAGRKLLAEAILTAFEREQVLLDTFSTEERELLISLFQHLIAQSQNLAAT